MSRRSIRWRIQLWHGAVLILSVSTISALFFVHERQLRIEQLASDINQVTSSILPRLQGRPPPGLRSNRPRPPRWAEEQPSPNVADDRASDAEGNVDGDEAPENELPRFRRPIEELIPHDDIYYIAWDRDGETTTVSQNAPADIPPPKDPDVRGQTYTRKRSGYVEAVHYSPRGGSVVVGIPKSHIAPQIRQFAFQLAGSAVAIVAVGLGVGWWMLGRETSQLSRIAQSAERITHGNLSERISLDSPSLEVEELANVLNETFMRLENSFEQQVRFTADASHELRTPVSVILAKGQYILAKPRSPEEYQKAIGACIDSAQHMKKTIESLLDLARFDSGEAALNLQEIDLAAIAADSVELLRTLAESKRIKLRTDLQPAPVLADPLRLQQVCINLISNAIKYSPFGREVLVSSGGENGQCHLEVADDGVGIDEEDLPYLFDRFFRGKRPNGDEKEHTGLGLAISKAIILAHHGTIQATNRPNSGALFRLALPQNSRANRHA